MKSSIKIKTLLVVIIATLYSALVSVYISYHTYSNTIDRYYKNTITNIAKSAGSLMDADKIGEYADSLEQDADYDKMLEVLGKIRENNDIAYLYVQKVVGDKAIAIMDSDLENPMGFRETFDVSSGADTSSLDEGVPAFISNEKGVGWMCSVFAPIKNSSGETVALVGADMSMDEVMNERHQFLITVCVAIALVTILAAVVMVVLITKLVVNPINDVATAAAGFVAFQKKGGMEQGEESPISKLNIRTKDEIGNLAKSVKIMEKEIRQYITELTVVTAEKERIGAELNVATQIQADMLPRIFPPFPEHSSEFDIYATMSPAKEVGGDFYDFFMTDDDHIVLVIADVSGKGVPAALFMVIARTLIKNCAQMDSSPKNILEKVNKELCENNDAQMFVTTWIGIVELSTGVLRAANAGHEYPVIKRADGEFELHKDKHGLVLAGMDMAKYREYELQLNKGDMLYVYTDGVPEATNSDNELYGTDRMLNVLNRNKNVSLKTLLGEVRKDIDAFVGDAPQFDDITMMAFSLDNIGRSYDITVTPDEDSIAKVEGFVESKLKEAKISDKIIMKINIVTDEVYSNIVRCSKAKKAIIRCVVSSDYVKLVFEDDGIEYNPLENPDPDITLSAEDRQVGGLGIFIVKKAMDELNYEYKDGKNILSLNKNLNNK